MVLRLNNFHHPVFKFTNTFFCFQTYLWIFTLVTVLFDFIISFWFLFRFSIFYWCIHFVHYFLDIIHIPSSLSIFKKVVLNSLSTRSSRFAISSISMTVSVDLLIFFPLTGPHFPASSYALWFLVVVENWTFESNKVGTLEIRFSLFFRVVGGGAVTGFVYYCRLSLYQVLRTTLWHKPKVLQDLFWAGAFP